MQVVKRVERAVARHRGVPRTRQAGRVLLAIADVQRSDQYRAEELDAGGAALAVLHELGALTEELRAYHVSCQLKVRGQWDTSFAYNAIMS